MWGKMFILISFYIKDHFSAENKVHERSFLIFLVYIKVSRLNSVMFMGEQFQKKSPLFDQGSKKLKNIWHPKTMFMELKTC